MGQPIYLNPNAYIVIGALLLVGPTGRFGHFWPGSSPSSSIQRTTVKCVEVAKETPASRVHAVVPSTVERIETAELTKLATHKHEHLSMDVVICTIGTSLKSDKAIVLEAEMMLKSLLHNSPPGGVLVRIHLLIHKSLSKHFTSLTQKMQGTLMPAKIVINVLEVDAVDKLAQSVFQMIHMPNTFKPQEAMFLFVPFILSADIDQVLYMELGGWIMANPASLLSTIERRFAIVYPEKPSTSVMSLNLPLLRSKLWPLLIESVSKVEVRIEAGKDHSPSDIMLKVLSDEAENLFSAFPAGRVFIFNDEKSWNRTSEISAQNPYLTIFHSSMHRSSNDISFWEEKSRRDMEIWQLAMFYVDFPWSWLKSAMEIQARAHSSRSSLEVISSTVEATVLEGLLTMAAKAKK